MNENLNPTPAEIAQPSQSAESDASPACADDVSPLQQQDASQPGTSDAEPKKVDLVDWFKQAELILQKRHRSWPRENPRKLGALALNGWPRDAQRVMVLISVLRDQSARVDQLERGLAAMRTAHDIVAQVASDFVLLNGVHTYQPGGKLLIDVLLKSGKLPPLTVAEAADPKPTPITGPSEPLDDDSLPVDADETTDWPGGATMPDPDFPYRFSWSTGECGSRRGQVCRIVRNGKGHGTFMHSTVLVEFADGAQFVVARAALSRIPNR